MMDTLVVVVVAHSAGLFYLQLERRMHDIQMEFRQEVNTMKLKHGSELYDMQLKLLDFYKIEANRKLSDLQRTLEGQIKLLDETLSNSTKDILTRLEIVERNIGTPTAFYSRLSQDYRNSQPGTILKFDDAILNIGNRYNPLNGKFIAAEHGIYFFSWSCLTKTGGNIYIWAYVNGQQFVDTCTYSDGNRVSEYNRQYSNNNAISNSGTFVMELKKNDEVWLQVYHREAEFLHSKYTYFTGHKVLSLP
ncbi:complement C1q-like protein 2 [Saccostrea cucullata]|uniref:complement C1q-like protein 2 n=1 Tax=Saccostrea cuccullata TaxID=36930 RepID=UPI002ED346AF